MKTWYWPIIIGSAVTYIVWTWNKAASLVALIATAGTAFYFWKIESK